jgi:hypothetical protein
MVLLPLPEIHVIYLLSLPLTLSFLMALESQEGEGSRIFLNNKH